MDTQITDFFADVDAPEKPSNGMMIAILVGITGVLIYGLYHGISASMIYAGAGGLARGFQVAGIATIEYLAFAILIALYRGEIVNSTQMWVAGTILAVALIISALNVVVDSRIHAGLLVDGALQFHLQYILPVAPFIMLIGGSLVVELSPAQFMRREQSLKATEFSRQIFRANLAANTASHQAAMAAKNVGLTARQRAVAHLASYYNSAEFQTRLREAADAGADRYFRDLGIEDIPGLAPLPQTPAPIAQLSSASPAPAPRLQPRALPGPNAAPADPDPDPDCNLIAWADGQLPVVVDVGAQTTLIAEIAPRRAQNPGLHYAVITAADHRHIDGDQLPDFFGRSQ